MAERGGGGLVTAPAALAEQYDAVVAAATDKADRAWIEQTGNKPTEVENVLLRMVRPSRLRYDQYYNVIANPLLWFIQHQLWDIPRAPSITRETWKAWTNGYVAINKLFADVIVDSVKDSRRPVIIFPQDYHLYLVPRFLRECLGSGADPVAVHIRGLARRVAHPARSHPQRHLVSRWPGPIGFQTLHDAFILMLPLLVPDATRTAAVARSTARGKVEARASTWTNPLSAGRGRDC